MVNGFILLQQDGWDAVLYGVPGVLGIGGKGIEGRLEKIVGSVAFRGVWCLVVM